MRLYEKRYGSVYEEIPKDDYADTEMDVEQSVEAFFRMIEEKSKEENYKELPDRIKALPDYIKLVELFSETYAVDTTIDSKIDGVEVHLHFYDGVLPQDMTISLGRIITCSSSISVWTNSRNQEYDFVIELDYNTHEFVQPE